MQPLSPSAKELHALRDADTRGLGYLLWSFPKFAKKRAEAEAQLVDVGDLWFESHPLFR